MECVVCAADCTEQAGATSRCGDGRVDGDAGEGCDDGIPSPRNVSTASRPVRSALPTVPSSQARPITAEMARSTRRHVMTSPKLRRGAVRHVNGICASFGAQTRRAWINLETLDEACNPGDVLPDDASAGLPSDDERI